jgi:hypothetical protein
MVANRAKKIVSVNFVESNPMEVRLAGYLKAARDKTGEEVKERVMMATGSFFNPIAIGEDPNSSTEDIEEALINSLINLSGQMSRLISYCGNKHGIHLSSESWRLLGLMPSVPSIVQQPEIDRSHPKSKGKRSVLQIEPDEDEEDLSHRPSGKCADSEFDDVFNS